MASGRTQVMWGPEDLGTGRQLVALGRAVSLEQGVDVRSQCKGLNQESGADRWRHPVYTVVL